MATTDMKYLDLEGLQHLLDKLNSENRIVKHTIVDPKEAGAYKITVDATGHVAAGDLLTVSDIDNAAAKDDIKDSTITLSINGIQKTFTLNQAENALLNWTLNEIGLSNALHFREVVIANEGESDLDAISRTITDPANGDVCLIGNKEYIYSDTVWYELGDAESHALKSVQIAGDGEYITVAEGGTLAGNTALSHKLYNEAKAIGAYNIAIDAAGHVSKASPISITPAGGHGHTASVDIPADTYIGTISPTDTRLSIKQADSEVLDVVTSYDGETSYLETTNIYGVKDTTTTASKATAGTQITYGTADVGATTSGLAIRGDQIIYGNANIATSPTNVMIGFADSAQAYSAAYSEDEECLTLTALTPATQGIYEAVESESTTYGCVETAVSVTSAKAADASQTITPWTFNDVAVPIKNDTLTTAATGNVAANGQGASVMTGLGTKNAEKVVKTMPNLTIVAGTEGDVKVLTEIDSSYVGKTSLEVQVVDAGDHSHNIDPVL